MENYVGWFLASVSQIEIGPNLIIDNRTVHAAYFVSWSRAQWRREKNRTSRMKYRKSFENKKNWAFDFDL